MQNLRLNPTILRKFRGKIETLSTRNLLRRKFAAVFLKIATFCPAYFFNRRRRWVTPCDPIWHVTLRTTGGSYAPF